MSRTRLILKECWAGAGGGPAVIQSALCQLRSISQRKEEGQGENRLVSSFLKLLLRQTECPFCLPTIV